MIAEQTLAEAAGELVAERTENDEPKIVLVFTRMKNCFRVDVPPAREAAFEANADGPAADGRFWWKGKSVRLRPREWRLVAYLWAEKIESLEDVRRAVWPVCRVNDSTVRVSICTANAALLKVGCAVQLTQEDGFIKIA